MDLQGLGVDTGAGQRGGRGDAVTFQALGRLEKAHGTRCGDSFADYLDSDARALGQAVAEVMNGQPPAPPAKPRGRKAKASQAT